MPIFIDSQYVIDAVEGVSFLRSESPTPNFQALSHGSIGLEIIARTVWHSEQRLLGVPQAFIYPENLYEDGIISSYFYWFGVTLVNHCRLCGMLIYLHRNNLTDTSLLDSSTRSNATAFVRDYIKSIIPDIPVWRHKLGAHFAFTDPRAEDTLLDLQQSIMTHSVYVRGRWRACGARHGDNAIPEWSVTEEMERLKPRFWPHFEYIETENNPIKPIPDRSKRDYILSTGNWPGTVVRLQDPPPDTPDIP